MVRKIIKPLALVTLLMTLLLAAHFTAAANGDFSLQLKINGDDVTDLKTIVIDPESALTIGLYIYDVTQDIILERISVAITFAGQNVFTLDESAYNVRITTGSDYREEITVNAKDVLRVSNLVTGIYRTVIKLEYTASGGTKVWSDPKNIRIPGNPLGTPLGAATAATTGGAVAAVLMLLKSLVSPGLPVGVTIPGSTSVSSLPRLHDFAANRLESTARGRLMGSVVKAAKRRVIKNKCPVCGTRLKHGHCVTCKKSIKKVRSEYVDRVKTLVLQSTDLLASGQIATLDDLSAKLGISGTLSTDVIATLKGAKLVKVRGIAGKLMGKAVMAGISSGLSAILWITVGGLVVLSTSVLVAIIVASIVVPVVVTKSLQMKTKRALIKHS